MKTMPTRWILAMLKFFAVSTAVALAVVALAPMPSIRFFGFIALMCALAGVALHLYLLRQADSHAWMVLRYHVASLLKRVHARWRAAFQRDDLSKVQP